MMSKGLIDKIFSAASIQRWNDHIRPVELTELDKQAHKMVIAYFLAKLENQERNVDINWKKLIEGGVFEFLQRIVLTDIKPPVFHMMMEKKGDKLNRFVLKELADDLKGLDKEFRMNFEKYLFNDDFSALEKRILQAAHYMATNWEFSIIYNASPFVYGIEDTREEIDSRIKDHYDLIGVQKISEDIKAYGFIDLCGQLRFQKRWANTPRIPETSVLGHMYIVAILTYLCSIENGFKGKRLYNNFFAALFHDLPELLTRDIISPVKSSVEDLEDIIKEYEKIQMEDKLLPLLPHSWRDEMRYFTRSEFKNKIIQQGKVKSVSFQDLNTLYDKDEYSPLDGELIQACDNYTAFVEASLSIEHGIKSETLQECIEGYKEHDKKLSGINFAKMYEYYL